MSLLYIFMHRWPDVVTHSHTQQAHWLDEGTMKLDYCKEFTERCNQFATALQELHTGRAKAMKESGRVLNVFSEIRGKVHFTENENEMVVEAEGHLSRISGTH